MLNGSIQKASGGLFVESLKPNAVPVTVFLLVGSCEVKTTKRGAPYLSAVLRDRTGEIAARMWDSDVPMERNGFIKAEGFVEEFNEDLQMKLTRWRKAKPEEIRIEDFLPASKRDRDEMVREISKWVKSIKNPELNQTTRWLVENYKPLLRDAPAAKGNHQPYLGGLAEHILNLCRLVDAVTTCYTLDRDLLIAAAILHDIGKIKELEYALAIDYTRRGTLLGHIGIGLQMLRRAIDETCGQDYSSPTFEHLEHLVASHHGRLEWGALCEPMSREAHVLHALDLIDSRCAKFDQCKETGIFLFNRERMYIPEPEGSIGT